tara:strand:- start:122 stop:766 length:645 start_codon:yes stop_codon:yes gene_type:complete
MNSIPNRIEIVIKYYNMSYNSFAKSLGLANGTGIKTMIDNNRNPQNQTLNKIVNTYPEIDMNWLRTGTGQMISNLPESMSGNDDLTVTAKQIIAKLDHDNINYREMLSNKLKDDRDYYDNESNHVKNISNILEGFKTLEEKVEKYAVQATTKVVDQMSKAIAKQNELLMDGYEKVISLETELEDIKTYMAANFELDKMNKKKSKQIKRLNPKQK